MEKVIDVHPDNLATRRPAKYRTAKMFQTGAVALNNTATNAFMFLMTFVSYYATGIIGLGTVLVSTRITASRLWDGITDPIIGLWIDKTDSKLGKFRPFMITGYVVMTITTLLLFFTNHLVPENLRLPYFILLLYVIYIVGYTFQKACTKSGQTVLTNDPNQQPLFSTFDLSYTSLFFAEFIITVVLIVGVLTLLAVAGIWKHDRTANFGTGGK